MDYLAKIRKRKQEHRSTDFLQEKKAKSNVSETVQGEKSELSEGSIHRHDWLAGWREVAELTSGLTATDPRLSPVLAALNICDAAFMADDLVAFQKARTGVIRAMVIMKGSR